MPVSLFDSTNPEDIPGSALYIAIYGTGRYKADKEEIQARYPNARIWNIDADGTDPGGCGIADIERYDMQPKDFPSWSEERIRLHPGALCIGYCDKDTWPTLKSYVSDMADEDRDLVRYWIADPTGIPHIVPGSDATQWDWGRYFDESNMDIKRFG